MSEKLHWDKTSSGIGVCGATQGLVSRDKASAFVKLRDTCDRCSQLALESMITLVDRKIPRDQSLTASAMSQKTRDDFEQDLEDAITQYADAVVRERIAKEERRRAHEKLLEVCHEMLEMLFPGSVNDE